MQRLEAKGVQTSLLKQPVWVIGLLGMISGEVGNLAAYGDAGTPAAVITAVGCVGVVANLFIATLFLKEPFRYRDLMGSCLVVGGVFLISIFKLEPEAPLTGDRLLMMISAPGAIAVYGVYGGGILFFLLTIKKLGDLHVIFYLLLSSLIGAFTVISSKPVSTFIIKSIVGLSTGTFNDVLVERLGSATDYGDFTAWPARQVSSAADCTGKGFGDGVKWLTLQSTEDKALLGAGREMGCYNIGLGELDQPAFWIFLIVLIVTAITQVKYLNDALARFDNSEVIPTHYVCFTLLSVTGATVVYQEWHIPMHAETGCSSIWRAHLFLDGMLCTILGVYFITTMRDNKMPAAAGSVIDGDSDYDDDPLPPPAACADASAGAHSGVSINGTGGTLDVKDVRLGGIERKGSALGDLKRSGSSPSASNAGRSAATAESSARREPSMKRRSIAGAAAEMLPIPQLSGVDARPQNDHARASRTSNYMALLAGPRSASTFMFDPQDREETPSLRASRRSIRGEPSFKLDITGDIQHRPIVLVPLSRRASKEGDSFSKKRRNSNDGSPEQRDEEAASSSTYKSVTRIAEDR